MNGHTGLKRTNQNLILVVERSPAQAEQLRGLTERRIREKYELHAKTVYFAGPVVQNLAHVAPTAELIVVYPVSGHLASPPLFVGVTKPELEYPHSASAPVSVTGASSP